ncbi:hypothetical protein HK099_002067, partial [Clydaea vesicula]
FQIDQEYKHKEYLDWLTNWFFIRGYCASIKPKTINRGDIKIVRLTLYTYTNLDWIYNAFYKINYSSSSSKSTKIKVLPSFVANFLTPASLAALIMQDGSRQKGQGVFIATNCFTFTECQFLSSLLSSTFDIKTSVVSAGVPQQWR